METKLDLSFDALSSEDLEKELGLRGQQPNVILSEEKSLKLIKSRDENGNNLLARCAIAGKLEHLKILLKCSVIDVAEKNEKGQTAADIALEGKNYYCLLALLQADSPFPDLLNVETEIRGYEELKLFIQERENLHQKIENGDLESVKKITGRQDSRFFLSPKNVSAMYIAFSSRQFEIYAYLQYIGAKFKPDEEREQLNSEEVERLNNCMEEYFMESQDAHILKLLGSSKSVQNMHNLQKKVERLYRHLDKFGSLALLMKILAYKDVDIIFDFEEETVDRLRYGQDPALGLADGSSLRIYVAAKPFKNDTGEKKVAGVLAHELCHLVMQIIFKNNCKPYRKDDLKKREELENILQGVKERIDGQRNKFYSDEGNYEILSHIFLYDDKYRHSELISRAYELVVLGEEMILRKEFQSLYKFYRDIVDHCQNYLKDKMKFIKPVNLCHSLMKTIGMLSKIQSTYGTLRLEKKLDLEKFKAGNEQSSTLILKSSVPALTCMSLYVYLRTSFTYHFSKQCIIISIKKFLMYKDIILDAFRCKCCSFLVLVSGEGQREKKLEELFKAPISEGKTVIFIQSVPVEEDNTCLSYEWKDLPEKFKGSLMNKQIDFQGTEMKMKDLFDSETASEIIHHNELSDLIKKKVKMGKEHGGYSENLPKYFIDRKFQEISPGEENDKKFDCEEFLKKAGESSRDIIVSDIFGSGKRTMLTHIMKAIKKINPKEWLVRLKCQDYIHTKKEQNAISHLLKTLKVLSYLEGSCLEKLLQKKGKVKIFFDGHQKLKEEDQKLFLSLVLQLRQETKSQLWFFTIPEYEGLFFEARGEKDVKLSLAAFRICKLEKDQQVELINKYKDYKRSLETVNLSANSKRPKLSSPLEETSAEEILEYFSPEFDNIAKEAGSLILLIDAFNDGGKELKKMDILSKVVNKKISMIFDKEKVVDDAIREPLLELYHNEHEKIAFESIKQDLMPSGLYFNCATRKVKEYIHHIGLLSPGTFKFLQPIIKDYFCVEWVNKTIEKDFPRNIQEGHSWKIFRSLLIQKLESTINDECNSTENYV